MVYLKIINFRINQHIKFHFIKLFKCWESNLVKALTYIAEVIKTSSVWTEFSSISNLLSCTEIMAYIY